LKILEKRDANINNSLDLNPLAVEESKEHHDRIVGNSKNLISGYQDSK
jgi:hypothetical protein